MANDNPEKQRNAAVRERLEHELGPVFLSFFARVIITSVALAGALFLKLVKYIPIPDGVPLVLGLWLITSLGCVILLRPTRDPDPGRAEKTQTVYYFLGVIYATAIAYLFRNAGYAVFLIYVYDLAHANMLIKGGRARTVNLFFISGFMALVLLLYRDMASSGLSSHEDGRVFIVISSLAGCALFLMAYSVHFISEMKETINRKMAESNAHLTAKVGQTEDIANELRKKVAENTYIKRATMGYITKKEYERDAIKKDLEEQIEKLRRTQKSMYFMIEDLNAMSGQLKEGRDTLEEKVRARTDELLEISRKLARSERLAFLGKLAGSVTHELRNPLSVLKNAAYYLNSFLKDAKDEKAHKYIEIIEKEISIIDSIIDDIMGFAKTSAVEFKQIDVRDVVNNALTAIKVPELIKVKKTFQEVPVIFADGNQIMHAIMNIANNAIMAMNGNGTLTFGVFERGQHVYVEIGDTGPGIPPQERDLIFEPLYSSKPKGTGLGLPIAKMMTENQDGRIEFESEMGEGTVFKLIFPVTRPAGGVRK